jgi:hypothetical protein
MIQVESEDVLMLFDVEPNSQGVSIAQMLVSNNPKTQYMGVGKLHPNEWFIITDIDRKLDHIIPVAITNSSIATATGSGNNSNSNGNSNSNSNSSSSNINTSGITVTITATSDPNHAATI